MLLADLIFSPSLSLETGIKYFHRSYETDDLEDIEELKLPIITDGLGPLKNVDHWMLEVPMNLKYRYPINLETHWLVNAGYSTNIYLKEHFEYGYDLEEDGGSNLTVSTTESIDQTKIHKGSLNLGLGISHQFENKKTLETSIYYQHSLGKQGVEQVSPNFFGVRGVYWLGKK